MSASTLRRTRDPPYGHYNLLVASSPETRIRTERQRKAFRVTEARLVLLALVLLPKRKINDLLPAQNETIC
jgi:hypothetical protein